jgi:hypothetical protein
MDEPVQTKLSKLAILSVVLGILSLFLFVLAGIPALIIGIVSIFKVRHSGGELKGRYIALAAMSISILFMVIFYLLWRIDAPPIPNDYTAADLRSAPAQYAESYEILKALIDENPDSSGVPAIELTNSDTNMIAEIKGILEKGTTSEITKAINYYAEEINQIWADNERARDVIHHLNEFPQIADLTELNANMEIMHVGRLTDLARLYQVYAQLKIKQSDTRAFVAELIEFDSVCRKVSVNARMLVPKIVCHIRIIENTLTANAIVNDEQTPMSTVELLAGHFIPLTDEQTSLRNSILSEYLLMKSLFSKKSGQSIVEKILPLKKNSILRLFRNCHDSWLDAEQGSQNVAGTKLSVWPDIYPFKEPSMSLAKRGRFPLLYRCYNPPVNIINIVGPLDKTIKSRKESIIYMQIQNDLLQIVLNKRLGKDFSLKARAYSDEYIVDVEKRKIFSPGPNGRAGTKDDIILRINPEVLDWMN